MMRMKGMGTRTEGEGAVGVKGKAWLSSLGDSTRAPVSNESPMHDSQSLILCNTEFSVTMKRNENLVDKEARKQMPEELSTEWFTLKVSSEWHSSCVSLLLCEVLPLICAMLRDQ